MKPYDNPEVVERLAAAASKIEARLWTPGVSEDNLTPEHTDLIQALAAYNSQADSDVGWPLAARVLRAALDWRGSRDARGSQYADACEELEAATDDLLTWRQR